MTAALQPQSGQLPFAPPSELSQVFWDGCRADQLLYQYFPASATAQFPPLTADRLSGDAAFEWRKSEGRGYIYSFSVVWRPQTSEFCVPYAVVIVELDEGFRFLSNLVGCTTDEVAIGARVRVVFHHLEGGRSLPYFRLDSTDSTGLQEPAVSQTQVDTEQHNQEDRHDAEHAP